MSEARILVNGDAINSTGMTDFRYTKYGSIQGFKHGGVIYRYCIGNKYSGYYDFDKYLDFAASNPRPDPRSLVSYRFIQATTGDMITLYQREISADFNNVCWITYSFAHVKGRYYGDYERILPPEGANVIEDPNSCIHSWEVAKEFYNDFINKAKQNGDKDYAEVLADIQQILEHIEEDIFSKLDANANYQPYIVSQRGFWRDSVTYNFSDKSKYVVLLALLRSFSVYFQAYQKLIGNDSTLVYIYIASILEPKVLEHMPLDIKMDMLSRLANRSLYNWQLFYNPANDQSVIVTVVESINADDADRFLDLMISTDGKYVNASVHLFKSLWDGLNNSHLGLGKSNLHDFVFGMYKIWAVSNYNPYKDGIYNQSNFQKYTYNRLLGCSPDEDGYWGTLGLTYRELNFSATPFLLNYTSSQFLGYYLDDFTFYFSDDDSGSREGSQFKYDLRFFDNTFAPTNKILVVDDNYRGSGSKGLYGTYDYYQPVSLVDSNQETIVKIPVIHGDTQGPHSENINNLIPIFVLKYIDDQGDRSDFWTSVGYFLDIASLIGGGYGLIEKLKFIHSISGFTSAIIEGSEFGLTTLVSLYATAATQAINLSAATVSFLLKLTGDSYKTQHWYKKLLETVTWIELLSAGGSVLSDRLLKVSTKNLVSDFGEEWPIEFTTDERGLAARETLTKIAGISVDAVLQRYKDRIKAKIESLLEKENSKKFSASDANGVARHSEEVLSEIMELGFAGKATEGEIAAIVFISYKGSKLISSEQLLLQTKYFINVIKVNGFPAGFLSLEDYKAFCDDVRDFWRNTFAELGGTYELDFSTLKYELKIQGSACRKRLPSDPVPEGVDINDYAGLLAPGDIEFAVLMDESNFDLFIDRIEQLIRETTESAVRKNLLKSVSYAKKAGVFRYGNFEEIKNNGDNILEAMRDVAFPHLTGFDKDAINFAFIKNGSKLDLEPYIAFKYN